MYPYLSVAITAAIVATGISLLLTLGSARLMWLWLFISISLLGYLHYAVPLGSF